MLIYVILCSVGCLLGIVSIVSGIIFRKRLAPWLMMFMIFIGFIMMIGFGIMAMGCSIPFLPDSLQK